MKKAADDVVVSAWWRYFWYWIVFAFITVLTVVLGPPSVRGWRRVPKRGGLLILSNHLADFDPILIQVACRRRIRFMGKSELFEMRVLKTLMRWGGAFPVKRGEPDREALKKSIRLLKGGETVCIFPEGQLSEDGKLQELKPGVGLIAKMAGVPVICCGIKNTNYVIPYGQLTPRPGFHRLHVRWSEPHQFGKDESIETIVGWAEAQIRTLTDQELVPFRPPLEEVVTL
jgi:1-acyl-sn-glycerol-3-phosphate acyltransferase